MRSLFRRLFKLTLLAGLGYVAYRLISEQAETTADAPRSAPPAPPAPPSTNGGAPKAKADGGTEPAAVPAAPPAPRTERAGTSPSDTRPSSGPSQPKPGTVRSIGVGEVTPTVPRWVAPNEDGSAPDSHPVKANMDSGIFHVPGGAHYDRVTPDRCYRDPEAAEQDGLRPSKQ